MVTYQMSDLIHWSLDELRAHEQVPIKVICDDGEIDTTIEEITLSWFLWRMHRVFPKTPCKVSHHIGSQVITPKLHLQILAKIQKDSFMASREKEYDKLAPYNKVVFESYNELYNFLAGELNSYITSISILDYVEVLDHPEIKAANDKVKILTEVSDKDIAEAYATITEVLDRDSTELENNSLRRAFKHRLISINQILQGIGPRGFVNDIDSNIFPKPIKTGYAEGIRELSDYLAESRTATLAEIMTGSPMQAAEYLNRLLQLSVSRVKHLALEDCGTQTLAPWFVDTYDKLTHMEGMYVLNEDTGKQEPINPKKHRYLVGQHCYIRTVFNCIHPDRDTICAKCFGDLAHNIVPDDNIGHISAIEFQSGQSQQILSFKHLTVSASTFGVHIDAVAQEMFKVTADQRHIRFLPRTSMKGLKLIIPRTSIRGFEHLMRIDSWGQVSPSRISWVHEIILNRDNADPAKDVHMVVSDPDNHVYFTLNALKFLVSTTYIIRDNGDYVFDMDGWGADGNLFSIPKIKFDVLEYTKMLETFIKGPESGQRINSQPTVLDFTDPIGCLTTFHDLVAQRMNTSLSHLQVVLLSTCCENPAMGDYRLPKDRMKGVFTSNSSIMRNNSAAVGLGYENQERDIYKTEAYIGKPRPTHPVDMLLFGEDVDK